jgi:hypothetical protein
MTDPVVKYLFAVDNIISDYSDKFSNLDAGVPLGIKANTAFVDASSDSLLITSANTYTKETDRVYYEVANNQTAIGGLTANTFYYVKTANSSAITLSLSENGSVVSLTESRSDANAEIHYLYKRDYDPANLIIDRGTY